MLLSYILLTAPFMPTQSVMSSLPAQTVLSALSAGSSKSDQKSGLAAGDSSQPSLLKVSDSTAIPPIQLQDAFV